jgi:hypothetical protein
MLSNILKKLQASVSNDDAGNRRASPRRVMDHCVGVVDGKTFPIVDWSNGGVLLTGDGKTIGLEDAKDVTLKFKLTDEVMSVQHRGRVIRKTKDKFAIRFEPLPRDIAHQFQQVIDDYVTREFASSQA